MTPVRAEPDGEVLVVTIDRPEARNAVNLAVAEGIAAALDRLDERRRAARRASSPAPAARSARAWT